MTAGGILPPRGETMKCGRLGTAARLKQTANARETRVRKNLVNTLTGINSHCLLYFSKGRQALYGKCSRLNGAIGHFNTNRCHQAATYQKKGVNGEKLGGPLTLLPGKTGTSGELCTLKEDAKAEAEGINKEWTQSQTVNWKRLVKEMRFGLPLLAVTRY